MGCSVEILSTQNPDLVEGESVNTPIYEKYDRLLHGGTRSRKYVITSGFIFKLQDQLDVYIQAVGPIGCSSNKLISRLHGVDIEKLTVTHLL